MIKIWFSWVWIFWEKLLNYIHKNNEGIFHLKAFNVSSQNSKNRIETKYNIKWYTDYKEMLDKEDIDVIVIATPDHYHEEICEYAINKWVHIFVEKPFILDIEAWNRLTKMAKTKWIKIWVDFHKRYDPDYSKLKDMISNNMLWDVIYWNVFMEDRIEVPTERFNRTEKTSPIRFLWVHYFDLLRYLLDDEVESVFAQWIKSVLKDQWIDCYDHIHCIMNFKSWSQISWSFWWILPKWYKSIVRQWLFFVWSKWSVEIDSNDRWFQFYDQWKWHTLNSHFMNDTYYSNSTMFGYGYIPLYEFLMDIYHERDTSWANAQDGIKASKIALSVHKSLTEWRTILVD